MFVEGFVERDGIKLHYIDWGGTGTPMVMLAGLGSTAHIYRQLAPKFRPKHRVLALTRRGHGRSGKPDSGYDLNTLADDIGRFLDSMAIGQAILVGHSFGGVEMPLFTRHFPDRVKNLIFLDALFPRSVPVPALNDDPVWSAIPSAPSLEDMVTMEAYLAYYRRFRPDLARIWGKAIEADVREYLTIQDDGSVVDNRDNDLLNGIYADVWSQLSPYDAAQAPMLAIVPDGNYHPSTPLDATAKLRELADQYWFDVLRPWIRARTAAFRAEVPHAQITLLDSPNHHIFIDQEDLTFQAIENFLDNQSV